MSPVSPVFHTAVTANVAVWALREPLKSHAHYEKSTFWWFSSFFIFSSKQCMPKDAFPGQNTVQLEDQVSGSLTVEFRSFPLILTCVVYFSFVFFPTLSTWSLVIPSCQGDSTIFHSDKFRQLLGILLTHPPKVDKKGELTELWTVCSTSGSVVIFKFDNQSL